ncbi:MAG TPA: YlbF family regulator [Verrucomicrobiae bacterium]|nr:YlbF family regulator [Verrucomicrobiae bacterium]
MPTQIEENTIVEKTRELCQTIVDQPEMISIRNRIDAFMADATARGLYETVANKGQALHEKQHQGTQPTGAEVADFEKHRDVLLNNSVARGFLDAREELHEIQHSIQKYISKTLETGRVPTEADFENESCGHGCGCGHNH